MSYTKKHFDDAKYLLRSDNLFDLANDLFHRKKKALASNDFIEAMKITQHGHFVCEMLTLKKYYQTDHWKEISGLTLASSPKCTNCSRPSECAHHNKYHGVKFREVPMKDVIALCNNCHSLFHDYIQTVANWYELQLPSVGN